MIVLFDLELISLIGKYGTPTVICIVLVAVVTNLYKNQLNLFAQTKLDYQNREDNLMQCFDKMSVALKDINTTMKDTNTSLQIIKERLKNG